MRLVKRGKRYSIVVDEPGGRQRWISTRLTTRADAKRKLAMVRYRVDRQRQGIVPHENPNLRLLPAIKVFIRRTKAQFSPKQRKYLKRRLLTMCYEIFKGTRVKRQLRVAQFKSIVRPYLRRRRVLDLACPTVEDWIAVQVARGRTILGHKGAHYKTVRDKIRLLRAFTDFWYRRKKVLPEDPLARLDMPPPNELPKSTVARKIRRPFEVVEVTEFFRASEFLDQRREKNRSSAGVVSVPVTPIFKALHGTGARPGELLRAEMQDVELRAEPYVFVPAARCKTRQKGERRATMHPSLAAELAQYQEKYRSQAAARDSFFLGPEGTPMDTARLLDQFYRSAYLAFVRLEARIAAVPMTDLEADEASFYLLKKKVRSVGGSRLRVETPQSRLSEAKRIQILADAVALQVSRRIEHLDTYAFRHTHATWASDRGVADVCISKQLGHSIRSTTGRYQHLGSRTLIDARRCSCAVWEMLIESKHSNP